MLGTLSLVLSAALPQSDAPAHLELMDVFELEHATDPRIARDGSRVVYVRRSMDVMSDRQRAHLWIVDADGANHRPLTGRVDGEGDESHPRWSPDGERLLYMASGNGSSQFFVRWMDTGQTAKLTNLTSPAADPAWSPDGRWIAFTMFVEDAAENLASMPEAPEGAQWAPAARVITALRYRSDGAGYLTQGNRQVFVLPAEGGTPRQLTRGPYDVAGPLAWSRDGGAVYFSSNRRADAETELMDSDLHVVEVASGELRRITDRYGPDASPAVSPAGDRIAYVGFDDMHQGYQVRQLYVIDGRGGQPRSLTQALDRSVESIAWSGNGEELFFSYSDQGEGKIGAVSLADVQLRELVGGVGGTTLGRPYSSGSFTVSDAGSIAYTHTTPAHPSDVALLDPDAGGERHLTRLNEDLLEHRSLGAVEELRFASSHDGLELQGWVVKPPGFERGRRYPLLLEIHGGPFANYGERFTAECQLYAAAGYVVLYMNPRGSTSYGGEFGNRIHHAYPGFDYDDLMSGVDAVIAEGYVDPERMVVTGGSGGGVLTAWIVGKTDRFRAAVVAKPVINWTSFALTADAYNFFHRYWFPGLPWDEQEHYWRRSPLSLVGNVSTPTMLLTGEADYRTPMSESEQYYQALKLCGVETALVRIPEASHGITARPSHLIAKVAHILAWFERHLEEAREDTGPVVEPAGETR